MFAFGWLVGWFGLVADPEYSIGQILNRVDTYCIKESVELKLECLHIVWIKYGRVGEMCV